MLCECGNSGPEIFENGRCWTCYLRKYHPDKLPRNNTRSRPTSISVTTKLGNFTKALVKHTMSGFKTVSDKQFEERLSVCDKCPFNKDWTCSECGCSITTKAKWFTQDCPKKYWPKITEDSDCGCPKPKQ